MKIAKTIRRFWHYAYYTLASEKGVDFALTCKEAAEQIDVGVTKSLISRIRFYLHISLCQGCKNYSSATQILGKAIRNVVHKNQNPDRLRKLNNDLLEKHSRIN